MRNFLAMLILLTGCANYSVLETCPEYLRANIGEIRTEPLNPLGLLFTGMVSPKDPNGTIHLYLFAGDNTLLEEAFHSFEIRAGYHRSDEWMGFYNDFHSDGSTYRDYSGPAVAISLLSVPFPKQIPAGAGYVNLYSRVSHFEDTAACFIALMEGKSFADDEVLSNKIEAVRKFINGRYRQLALKD